MVGVHAPSQPTACPGVCEPSIICWQWGRSQGRAVPMHGEDARAPIRPGPAVPCSPLDQVIVSPGWAWWACSRGCQLIVLSWTCGLLDVWHVTAGCAGALCIGGCLMGCGSVAHLEIGHPM